MRRAALYARVSTGLQEKEQTIESQLAAITLYAEQHGLQHSKALTYKDDGYSGTWLDRPGLDELRDHAREGRFDVVIVLCPDRLARRYAYQVVLLEELKRVGVEIHFCERPINDSPDDQLLLQIQGAIAEYERAKILERCRRGRLHRARRGELAPPVAPYGYHYAARKYGGDGQIRIEAEEAAMVRQLFKWYAEEGATLYRVLQKLIASPWKPRPGGKRWSAATVLRILHCEWHVGRAYYNRVANRRRERSSDEIAGNRLPKIIKTVRPRSEWIVVPVPRIIDDALFARVQQRIKENQRFSKRRAKRNYLLKGLLKCGLCGHAFTGQSQTTVPKRDGKRVHAYYACNLRSSPRRVAVTTRCTNDRLIAAGADEIVWTTVRDLLLDSGDLAKRLQAWLAQARSDSTAEQRSKSTATRLRELNRQRERLIDAYQAGALNLLDFQSRKTTTEERILVVEQDRAELHTQASRRELAAQQAMGAEKVAEQLRRHLGNAEFDTRQSILRLVVDKVVVTGRRLEIHLALPVSGSFHLTNDWGAKPPQYKLPALCLKTGAAWGSQKLGRATRPLTQRLNHGWRRNTAPVAFHDYSTTQACSNPNTAVPRTNAEAGPPAPGPRPKGADTRRGSCSSPGRGDPR